MKWEYRGDQYLTWALLAMILCNQNETQWILRAWWLLVSIGFLVMSIRSYGSDSK